jgi:hypothetical protein
LALTWEVGMAPLTGDFDAVVEVSARTLDRLCASMHQNPLPNPRKSTFPHISYFRVGDMALRIAGSVATQIGVPQVDLIDGSTSRVGLHVGIRARYRPDPGTTKLADVICGTVHAEYAMGDLDRPCVVAGDRADWVSLRLVDGSVSFDGDIANDAGFGAWDVIAQAQVKANVERLITEVLKHQFAPNPQKIGKALRRFRTLNYGDGPGDACVAFPVGLAEAEPQGDLGSIQEAFLGGSDVGLAVTSTYVEGAVQPQLDGIVGLQRDFHVHGDAGVGGGLEIDYHVRVDSADVTWGGPLGPSGAASGGAAAGLQPAEPLSSGVLHIHITGHGWSTYLYRSGVFNLGSLSLSDLNMTFTVDQDVFLTFDASQGTFIAGQLGGPAVSVNYGGPYAGNVIPLARDSITQQVNAYLRPALASAANQLADLSATGRMASLISQLRRIDSTADVQFQGASFRQDGIILLGTIPLAVRYPPTASFTKTPAGNGFDAIESWIPGGDINTFEWAWRWFTSGADQPPGPPGSIAVRDSFVLARPNNAPSKFGLMRIGEAPLPGLNGMGQMCLVIKGTQVDHVTGERVPVNSRFVCATFGFEFHFPYALAQGLRVCDPAAVGADGIAPEVGLMRAGVPNQPDGASNALFLYVGDTPSADALSTLRDGLARCRRTDVGLLVVILLDEGAVAVGGRKLAQLVTDLKVGFEAPLLVTEDIGGGWAKTLGIAGPLPDWRLLNPASVVAWTHSGRLTADELTAALDARLVRSRPPSASRIDDGPRVNEVIGIDLGGPNCPPLPLGGREINGSSVVFLRDGSQSGRAALERIRREQSSTGTRGIPVAAVIANGADEGRAAVLQTELGVPVFGDHDGDLTRQAQVAYLPTWVYLDNDGRVISSALICACEAEATEMKPKPEVK